MSAIILDGKMLAARREEETLQRVNALKARGITPGLAFILVGEDPASKVYVRSKNKACERCGIRSVTCHLSENVTQEELERELQFANVSRAERYKSKSFFKFGGHR